MGVPNIGQPAAASRPVNPMRATMLRAIHAAEPKGLPSMAVRRPELKMPMGVKG